MICISLSILVVIAGVFLLAKTKTDELGLGFKFASYAAILSGLLLTGATLTMCLSDCCPKKAGHHGHEFHQSCVGHDGSSGATCSKGATCNMGAKCCKYDAKCSKSQKCSKGAQKNCSKTVTINTTVEATEEDAEDPADN